MYKNFFGFKERPFQLVPNPAYLYLSKSHEEALAHLNYAVSEGDGFVEITGEVGAGKTTLCRVFLENLNENIECAYIFNPKLDSLQLLKAINDEFGIPSGADNIKELIDTLNLYLIEKKGQGKRTILLIDEAQNLTRDVLEQIRLLSNLETSTSKLLQILLVGQPELGHMLDSHDLRQLSQRITLSCHLMPLTLKETQEYIEHRLQVAARKPKLKFAKTAIRMIHRYAGGIPRLINIVCDRSLLTAYGLGKCKITGGIAATAIRELSGRNDRKRYGLKDERKPLMMLTALCCILTLVVFFPDRFKEKTAETRMQPVPAAVSGSEGESIENNEETQPDEEGTVGVTEELETADDKDIDVKPALAAVDSLPLPVPDKNTDTADTIPETGLTLYDALRQMDIRTSRYAALSIVLEKWDAPTVIREEIDAVKDSSTYFTLGAAQNGLMLFAFKGEHLEPVRKLNLPIIVELNSPTETTPAYMALVHTSDGKYMLEGESGLMAVSDLNELEFYWSGAAYIPWKNFYAISGILPREATDESLLALKILLKDIGFEDVDTTRPEYDDYTRSAVEDIQEKNSVKVDGVVGPVTKIILYNSLKSIFIPHILE